MWQLNKIVNIHRPRALYPNADNAGLCDAPLGPAASFYAGNPMNNGMFGNRTACVQSGHFGVGRFHAVMSDFH